jgi:hypothetical protein
MNLLGFAGNDCITAVDLLGLAAQKHRVIPFSDPDVRGHKAVKDCYEKTYGKEPTDKEAEAFPNNDQPTLPIEGHKGKHSQTYHDAVKTAFDKAQRDAGADPTDKCGALMAALSDLVNQLAKGTLSPYDPPKPDPGKDPRPPKTEPPPVTPGDKDGPPRVKLVPANKKPGNPFPEEIPVPPTPKPIPPKPPNPKR